MILLIWGNKGPFLACIPSEPVVPRVRSVEYRRRINGKGAGSRIRGSTVTDICVAAGFFTLH